MKSRREVIADELEIMAQRIRAGVVLAYTMHAIVRTDDWEGIIELHLPPGTLKLDGS